MTRRYVASVEIEVFADDEESAQELAEEMLMEGGFDDTEAVVIDVREDVPPGRESEA